MTRGKEAAQSARRREVNELTSTVESYQHAVRRLTTQRDDLARKLAEARRRYDRDTRILRAERDEATSPELAAISEKLRRLQGDREMRMAVLVARERLIYHASWFVSMTQGVGPREALSWVCTWVTEKPFRPPRDIERFCLDELLVPSDGWVAKTLRGRRTWDRAVPHQEQALPLEEVSLTNVRIHPKYLPGWWASPPDWLVNPDGTVR